ncbi:motility associated factor glycosyltransferase family protein [Thermodesulfobacteriota bacterium]
MHNNFTPTDRQKVYNANLAALKEHYPELFDNLSTINNDFIPNMIRMKPDDIFPNIVLEDKGEKILYYDSDDPLGHCKEYLESLDLSYAPVVIFLGFGLGYQVVNALQHFSKKLKIRHIIIIEKDLEILRAALMTVDLTNVIRHPEIKFFVGMEPHDLFKSFSEYFADFPQISHYLKNLKIVIMPSVHHVYADYYRNVVKSLTHSIMDLIHDLGNDPYDSVLGLEHMLANILPTIQDPGIISFENAFKRKPAILIGAGPSLAKNMHFLKEASHKTLLVCVDAAFRPLMNAGIRPHIVSTIERTEGTDNFYANLKGLEDIFFVFSTIVHPTTYHIYQGPKIIAQRYSGTMEWLGVNTGALAGGPLIGNFAFDIAQCLGCDPIIMVGQDLSFEPTGLTHVEGFVFGDTEDDKIKKNMIEVEGNFVETLMTSVFYDQSRRSLEIQIDRFDGQCVNATEGGAKINGTILMDLKSALNEYCAQSFDFSGHLQRIWAGEKGKKEDKKTETRRILSLLDRTVSELQDAIGNCRKGLKIIEATMEKYLPLVDKKPNPEAIENIIPAEKRLYDIRDEIISLPSFQAFSEIFNGYHVDFSMKKNFLFDQFHHHEFAALKAFIMEKEWFSIMGQLCLSTLFLVKQAKTVLRREGINHL